MTARLAQREAALAVVALLAAVGALAATKARSGSRSLPAAVGTYAALAGSSATGAFATHTDCGTIVAPTTEGVAHPVLPCGIRLFLTFRDRTVLTQVIAHSPTLATAPFDLSAPLAKRLGLEGVAWIRWSYAAAG